VKLQDKVVVVTGSASGIGEAFAHRFTREGGKVIVTDLDQDKVDAVASAIGSVGLAGDITEPATVRAVAEFARATYGEIDVWYSNAGLAGPRQPGVLPDDASWESNWHLHVMSHVHAAREVLPSMLERGDGYLLQTASSAALSTQPEKAAYAVTKHAALALSEWLALTYRPRGIKVSCFCPGPMLTPMLLSNNFPEDHPILTMALTPEQVADLLVAGIDAERFLIVENDAGPAAVRSKLEDYDGWLGGFGAWVT
jgi:NAD(P)-dependent dehydrogenase (short-subunit alcohol dehydrogenase family)